MKFYFYTNKNMLFDFLARNVIAPDPIVKDIKRFRTVSTASDYFLFVTHKMLDRKSREQGIAEPEFVYPVTLVLSEMHEKDGRAVLVSKCKSGYEYTLEKISDYNIEKHIGAYLIGEIPLSRVEKIYFDTQDEQDMFSRPSPDYWYPTNKYSLLPEGFSEELSIELEEDKIIEISGLNRGEILSAFRKREKKRAALLNFVNETKGWQYDRYLYNIDTSMQNLLGITDQEISAVLPNYQEVKGKGNSEYICLVDESLSGGIEFNQIVYNHICDTLIDQPYNTQKQTELIVEILHSICEKIIVECKKPGEAIIIRQIFNEIEKLISDTSDKVPEEIMAGIPEPIDVLKALLFVAKNPNRYDLFLESLNVYHADVLTKRRAAVLWGMLNGLYGMPGENFNKDNQKLWQFIEAFVYEGERAIVPSLAIEMPSVAIEKGLLLGIALKEERIVTAEEIREIILSTPKEKLTDSFYSKLLEAAEIEAGSKKKAENKGYAHSVASIALPEIKKGDELNTDVRKVLEQLVRDCKKSVPNKEKLFVDYVESESKFAFVFDIDHSYWKKVFKLSPENENA